jgi:hypothetical protein
MLKNMAGTSGGDLSECAVNCICDDLMAEDSISVKDTALLEFAYCYASGAHPQAKGHMHRSRNLGNGKERGRKRYRAMSCYFRCARCRDAASGNRGIGVLREAEVMVSVQQHRVPRIRVWE